jgi:molybdopterin converting factor small subunit
MSLRKKLRDLFPASNAIRVHVLVRGRIGAGWEDVDRTFALPPGSTLAELLDEAARQGVPLRQMVEKSPHLRHTLMLNGERCPFDDSLERRLADGDELYLLAPIAGG